MQEKAVSVSATAETETYISLRLASDVVLSAPLHRTSVPLS